MMNRKTFHKGDDIHDWTEKKKFKLDNLEINNALHNNKTVLKENNATSSANFIKDFKIHSDDKLEYLDTPIKLDIDPKEYRTIKLKNGLIALLISDTENEANDKKLCKSSTISCSIDNKENKSRNSENNEILDEEKIAYCSLCINVGNFSDPPHIQGLAHLLEHMISMGSKKYPQENDYDAFIQKRWGNCNAFTESEKTTYSFEIPEKYLLDALDRFAHLFIDPLIMKDAIIRERQAVESEFKMAQQLDSSRLVQLKHSFVRKNHPASKFPWGNLHTLQDNVNIDELYLQLHKFRKRHYSAHRMTLAVQGSASLDKLEQYVKKCFSDIPVNYLPTDDFSQYVGTDSFNSFKFRRLYNVKTIKDISEVEFNWIMPPMHHMYKSKPWEYIFWLLNRTGEGSLYHYLRKRMWCLEIYNGSDEAFEHSSMYCLFSLSLVLTDEGYNHLNEIFKIVFSYINLLRREGTQKIIFSNMKQMKEDIFKSSCEHEYERFVENMSQNMQYYAPADYLSGYDLIFEYNPESIKSCIDLLSPENVNIIVSNRNFNDKDLDKVEPWFQTKYTSNEIPQKWINCWKQMLPLPEFHLPVKNNSSDSYLIKNDIFLNEVSHPIKICHNTIELWHKKLSRDNTLEFSIHLHLVSPLSLKSSIDVVMMNLLAAVLVQMTNEYLTEESRIILSVKGILIETSGTNKASSLRIITKILEHLIHCHRSLKEDLFNLVKTETLKMYYNSFIDPEKLNVDVCMSMLVSVFWTSNEKYNALSSITYEQFKEYIINFSKRFFIQCYVKGNLSEDAVLKSVYESIRPLLLNSFILNDCPTMKVYEFMRGEKCCQIKNFNSSDVNSAVTNYYQIGIASVRLFVMLEILAVIMDEPLFHHLRTQEQLGYKITCGHHYSHGVICFAITVVTQANKFTGEFIDERITNFINKFRNTLKDMSDCEFNIIKQSYIKLKRRYQMEDTETLDDNWKEILAEEYVFNRADEEIQMAKAITVNDIYLCVNNYMIVGANYRKLSVQIVGTPDSSNAGDEINDQETEKYTFKYSTEITDEKRKSGYYINDIRAYKDNLNIFR